MGHKTLHEITEKFCQIGFKVLSKFYEFVNVFFLYDMVENLSLWLRKLFQRLV